MKHAHKLRNLLADALYCAEADNETKMRELWDTLKLAEQISALVNVQIFDEWQTLEKAEFVLQRANEVLSDYRDLADIINRNPTAKGLFYSSSQWRELELCLMEEHAELTMCMVSKNMQTTLPKQATTPEPATEPEQADNKPHVTAWLKEVFGNDTDLIEDFLREVQNKLERKPTQKASALLSTFIRYKPQWYKHKSNNALAEQLELCTGVRLTPQNFSHYKEDLEKFPKTDK